MQSLNGAVMVNNAYIRQMKGYQPYSLYSIIFVVIFWNAGNIWYTNNFVIQFGEILESTKNSLYMMESGVEKKTEIVTSRGNLVGTPTCHYLR